MAKIFDSITPKLKEWIEKQAMFFVATAPRADDGHINLSPKGGSDSFCVAGPTEFVYQDFTGSGAETIAHLRENGRIVVMFNAYEGAPKIVRLHGKGTVILPGDASFEKWESHFPPHTGTRAFIHIEVTRISDSCGYQVPLYDFQGERDVLDKWTDRKGHEGVKKYQSENNRSSIDGLPALPEE